MFPVSNFFNKICNPKEYVAAQYKNEVLLQMESWEIKGRLLWYKLENV